MREFVLIKQKIVLIKENEKIVYTNIYKVIS